MARYNKKELTKYDTKRKGLVWFFELLTRKTGAYVGLNILYLITLLPAIFVLWVAIMFCVTEIAAIEEYAYTVSMLSFELAVLFSMLFSLSPFSSGYYYVLRNFTKEDNAWVLTDFFRVFRENAGKSIGIFVIDLLIVAFSFLSLRIYILMGLSVGVIALFIIMTLFALSIPYCWNLVVTFDLKLSQVYKNSFFLLFVDAKKNLLYILAVALYLLVILLIRYMVPPLCVIIVALLGVSSLGLAQEINVYPVIKKYLIDPQEEK